LRRTGLTLAFSLLLLRLLLACCDFCDFESLALALLPLLLLLLLPAPDPDPDPLPAAAVDELVVVVLEVLLVRDDRDLLRGGSSEFL